MSNVKSDYPFTQASCKLECQIEYATSQMSEDEVCVPWYLPTEDQAHPMCDPWAAVKFREYVSKKIFISSYVLVLILLVLVDIKVSLITDECDYCFPDCSGTIYEASVSAVPYRDCNNQNLGVSLMCNLDGDIEPPIFGTQVLNARRSSFSHSLTSIYYIFFQLLKEYEDDNEIPPYVSDNYNSNLRYHSIDPAQEVNTIVVSFGL